MSLVLGIDTCGPVGSVALARLSPGALDLLGQIELPSRNYTATLVSAVGELLSQAQSNMSALHAIAVTSGPGSFTGVRVGLAAVKGLAEPAQTPVVAVSRLAVLASVAGTASAALDAHRHELFLRIESPDAQPRELLAGASELDELTPIPSRIAVCDDAALPLLAAAWPAAELVRVAAPTAADLLAFAAPLIRAGQFADLALLDGHYLRRSDAEIFGSQPHCA
ncbi:MAG: tRNA (adenosine(37)-N6)-threonylcarbamoyltransferase complex dimerization subunit type 1 TsaB [Terracidiphilus sp.]|nr:tRNA (adenosine(37)-N6)-threonylcarbamoyltransferase complex dimerization subunit type 1 TsaB [Terracidiphilus sp.]